MRLHHLLTCSRTFMADCGKCFMNTNVFSLAAFVVTRAKGAVGNAMMAVFHMPELSSTGPITVIGHTQGIRETLASCLLAGINTTLHLVRTI